MKSAAIDSKTIATIVRGRIGMRREPRSIVTQDVITTPIVADLERLSKTAVMQIAPLAPAMILVGIRSLDMSVRLSASGKMVATMKASEFQLPTAPADSPVN